MKVGLRQLFTDIFSQHPVTSLCDFLRRPKSHLVENGIKAAHLANLFARTDKKVGTVPTCSRRIFSPANFNQSRCRIIVFASRRANKVAKWKIGLMVQYLYAMRQRYLRS